MGTWDTDIRIIGDGWFGAVIVKSSRTIVWSSIREQQSVPVRATHGPRDAALFTSLNILPQKYSSDAWNIHFSVEIGMTSHSADTNNRVSLVPWGLCDQISSTWYETADADSRVWGRAFSGTLQNFTVHLESIFYCLLAYKHFRNQRHIKTLC